MSRAQNKASEMAGLLEEKKGAFWTTVPQGAGLYAESGPKGPALNMFSRDPWHVRLWRVLTNPFFYVFTGRIKW